MASRPAVFFKDELNRIRVTVRFVRPSKLAIQVVAQELEQRFGGVPPLLAPLPNVVEEAEKRLIAGQGDISKLDRRQCKAVPYILWSSPRWSNNARLIGDYLAWADREWRTAPRQLWRHYLLNMEPGSLATQRLGDWLDIRADKLPPALHDFSRKWSLFSPQLAIRKLAGSLLSGSDFIAEIEKLRIGRKTLLESAFLLSVLQALGQRLQDYRQRSDITITLKSLLADLGETPTYKMHGPEDLRRSTLKSLVEGLIAWAERQGGIAAVDQTLDLLYSLIGDPRLYPIRWKDIDPSKRETVERWLARVTLDAFFKVIRALPTKRDDMVEERKEFWRRYEKSILRAWLITAKGGVEIAHMHLGQSFGKFETELNVQHNHLALMLQIGNYAILEMNQNGGTLFWPVGDQKMPTFFRPNYSRSEMTSMCPMDLRSTTGRFQLHHRGDWSLRYENTLKEIGVLPNR